LPEQVLLLFALTSFVVGAITGTGNFLEKGICHDEHRQNISNHRINRTYFFVGLCKFSDGRRCYFIVPYKPGKLQLYLEPVE
jgi:hypothetical protein